jgi:hypothetical protein
MNAGLKLGAYGLALVAALGVGAAVGAAAGPIDAGGSASHDTADSAMDDTMNETTELPAGGLLITQDGYHLVPEDRLADDGEFAFTILGPDGHPVTAYDDLHDRELHLIVASRDLREFAHLHPVRDAHGRWTADLPTFPAGAYRAFADFEPTGAEQYTLGVDLVVAGPTEPMEPLEPETTDSVAGFEVTLDSEGSEVTITVRRDGEMITTEPYLGAAGHLVALRDGDLAYLHVHPLDDHPAGPVHFAVEVPSSGTYALFFDFQVDGAVHTASFVLDVTASTGSGHSGGDH